MGYTVSDLFNTYSSNLNLIAGQGGLSREISSCGILDYELLPELKDKYFHSNIQNGQFILSSFVYAKDNPYMISDAIKYLVAKRTSGLAIRNVLKIQIPETVIRYADAKNFPIFTIQSMALPFESIIYTIGRYFELEKNANYYNEILNYIRSQDLSSEEIIKSALKINPSFSNQFFCIYCESDDFISDSQKSQIVENYKNSELYTFEDFICVFKDGILLVKSCENLYKYYNDDYVESFINKAFRREPVINIGISNRHNTLGEFKLALEETFFASAYNINDGKKYHYYRDIGTYKIIFPYCGNAELTNFSNNIMEKLEEYDTENNSNLIETLVTYINCNCNKDLVAEKLSHHEQTIRYRLNKIYSLTDLSRKSSSDKEQLSIACKIYIANRLLNK
ncbi:MAG: PucR family transcriptional regulator ligand-binding domain-containing protein [Lutispora sp.]|nr:PucR family transcriptional regulator ligand-binding domain-containing protein [Lutispora sp.]MDD4834522.1 PucR family transcriptional regulator ligand-binding domain-containing protein [Lutispora sp.]